MARQSRAHDDRFGDAQNALHSLVARRRDDFIGHGAGQEVNEARPLAKRTNCSGATDCILFFFDHRRSAICANTSEAARNVTTNDERRRQQFALHRWAARRFGALAACASATLATERISTHKQHCRNKRVKKKRKTQPTHKKRESRHTTLTK